jgi:tetratricopeptide (TPR) repeat protein
MQGRLFLAALLVVASACSNAPRSVGTAAERGLAALDRHEPRTARIEFLNAIQADPNNPRLHVLQARTYLLLGDGVAAEAEIARARRLGLPPAETHHLLAHAYLLQNDPDRAIAESQGAPPAYAAYAARMRGRAAMALGDTDQAAAAFNDALASAPRDSQVWTDVARFRRTTGETAGALAAADAAVAADPRSVEALTLRGELTRSQYGLAAAILWFDRALEIDPKYVPALAERAATLADLGQMKAMLDDTWTLLAISPGNPQAYYLQSLLAARAGKYDLASRLYERTAGALDGQPSAMLLAGAIEIETGRSERAVRRLQRLVAIQPDNIKARRLLAAASWRMGDAAGTIAALRPLADRPDADPYVLNLIAGALRGQGDSPAASNYRARAADPASHRAPALLSEPVDEERLALLRAEAARQPGEAQTQIRLIRALLGNGQSGEALQRARALEAANPGAPDAHMLAGDALGLAGDQAGAAAAYRRAANLAFTEPVALRLVAALRNSGDTAAAARVLELFLAQNPQNVPARLLAANALLEAGEWDGAIDMYEDLRARIGNGDALLLNNLAWAYSQKGEFARAIPLARHAWNLDRANPATADTLGWILFKSGRSKAEGLALIARAGRSVPPKG